MSTATSIEWAHAVWNPTVGCSRVSAGCERCYAELAARHGLDRYAVARRLPELARRGLIRREEVGAKEVRWWA